MSAKKRVTHKKFSRAMLDNMMLEENVLYCISKNTNPIPPCPGEDGGLSTWPSRFEYKYERFVLIIAFSLL